MIGEAIEFRHMPPCKSPERFDSIKMAFYTSKFILEVEGFVVDTIHSRQAHHKLSSHPKVGTPTPRVYSP